MGNHNPETIVGRLFKDEEQFRGEARFSRGSGSKNTANKPESNGRMFMGVERREPPDADMVNSGGTRTTRIQFQDAIGRELRNLYDDVAAQPVPDRFLNLLNQLEDNLLNSAQARSVPGESE